MIAILIFCSGCSFSKPNEKSIIADLLLADQYGYYFVDGETIENVSIEKSKTEGSDEYHVWCKIESSDLSGDYVKYLEITYILYDKGGWMINRIRADKADQWETTLKAGVTPERIAQSLIGWSVRSESDTWNITESDIISVNILEQKTDLDTKTDNVKFELELQSGPVMAKGTLDLQYIWTQSYPLENWGFTNFPHNDTDFIFSFVPGEELVPDEKQVISALEKSVFQMEYQRDVTISESEVLDFKKEETAVYIYRLPTISEYNNYNNAMGDTLFYYTDDYYTIQNSSSVLQQSKGMYQVVKYNFQLIKGVIAFQMNALAYYSYSEQGEWEYIGLVTNAAVNEVDMIGTWKGTYVSAPTEYDFEIEIDSVDDEGKFSGTFSFRKASDEAVGKCKIRGWVNTYNVTFEMSPSASDWIEKHPDGFSLNFADKDFKISADGMKLTGYSDNQELRKIQ